MAEPALWRKCGPMTTGLQGLGCRGWAAAANVCVMTNDKPLATVEEEEPGDSYSFVVCISGQPLLFQHECVRQRLGRQCLRFLAHSWASLPSAF